ncbi:non-hydrolyzing UDP-N-acetylglucosamine 2-epimerase [Leuconostoc citreum]|uniref:non-hydrolyzing UDP-N-acetylglucosamine 2-epimerase n=1 Tax=Leuconostoc citreum TaxID=33964 RepID=UPI0032DEC771
MKKIMIVFGTRPEAIKMAPLIKAIDKDERFQSITVVTAQHREMLDQVLDIFQIKPDYDLDIMGKNQTLSQITIKVLTEMEKVVVEEKPDIMLVHGDTSTTFAASIAAFYHHIQLGHVEDGLRTWNKYSPFPEEMNRQLTDVLSDIYFAPTEESKVNLLQENHAPEDIYITGNTAIDALRYTVPSEVKKDRRQILITMHRRENLGEPMENVFKAVKDIALKYSELSVVYPLHKNPKVREIAYRILGDLDNVQLIEPLNVIDFHRMENESYLILTDSGGVQEEAPSFGVPVLVLRDTTERPEGVAAGALKLIGTNQNDVYHAVEMLIENKEAYQKTSNSKNPYGDGFASEKILDAIHEHFNK